MIVVTVFFTIFNQMEFHLVQNRKENCHHDHIPFNLKGNRIRVLSVYRNSILDVISSLFLVDRWSAETIRFLHHVFVLSTLHSSKSFICFKHFASLQKQIFLLQNNKKISVKNAWKFTTFRTLMKYMSHLSKL